MASVNAGLAKTMKDTPTGRFAAQWPEPERFPQSLDKLGKMMGEDYDWCADVAKLPMPILLAYADHDSISQRHIADFRRGYEIAGFDMDAAIELRQVP